MFVRLNANECYLQTKKPRPLESHCNLKFKMLVFGTSPYQTTRAICAILANSEPSGRTECGVHPLRDLCSSSVCCFDLSLIHKFMVEDRLLASFCCAWRRFCLSYRCKLVIAASDQAAGVGIGTGPPGESAFRAVKTSTPVSVTRRVCSVGAMIR